MYFWEILEEIQAFLLEAHLKGSFPKFLNQQVWGDFTIKKKKSVNPSEIHRHSNREIIITSSSISTLYTFKFTHSIGHHITKQSSFTYTVNVFFAAAFSMFYPNTFNHICKKTVVTQL